MDDEQEAFDFIENYSFGELITSSQGELKASIDIEQVQGKAKLSQNRKESDQQGVIRGLQSKKDPTANLVAKLMVKKHSAGS